MRKVLIVDDEMLAIQYLSMVIDWENLGFARPLTAQTVHRALEIYQTEYPDIVITDIRMPELSGLELIQRFLEINPDCSMIVLTAYRDFEVVREAMKIGVKDFLLKHELNADVLTNSLKKAFDALMIQRSLTQIAIQTWLRDSLKGKHPDFPEGIFPKGVRWQLICRTGMGAQVPMSSGYVSFLSEQNVYVILRAIRDNEVNGETLSQKDCFTVYSRFYTELKEMEFPECLRHSEWFEGEMQGSCKPLEQFSAEHSINIDYAAKAAEILNHEYANSLHTADVAGRLYISEGYLRKVFRDAYGCSITEYLRNVRMRAACAMLLTDKYKIHDVAIACGFANGQQFSQVFRKEMHMTPAQYQKKAVREHAEN